MSADSSAACFYDAGAPAIGVCRECERTVCDACASRITVDDPPVEAFACPSCAGLFGVPSSIPFEDPGGLPAFLRTWWSACVRPRELFRAMPHRGFGRATVYAYLAMLPWGLCTSACLGLLAYAIQGFSIGHGPRNTDTDWVAVIVIMSIAWGGFLLAPVSLAVFGALWHLVVRAVGGRGPLVATYRLLCFLLPLRVAASIPAIIGAGFLEAVASGSSLSLWVAAEVWHSWGLYHAARRVHGLTPGGALAVAVTPWFCWCLVGGAVTLLTLGLAFLI